MFWVGFLKACLPVHSTAERVCLRLRDHLLDDINPMRRTD